MGHVGLQIFFTYSFRLVGCNALFHVILEIAEEEQVVVFVEAGGAEEIRHRSDGLVGVGDDDTALEVNLCVNTEVFNLEIADGLVKLE